MSCNSFKRGMVIEINDEDRKQEYNGQIEEVLKQTMCKIIQETTS